MNLRPVALDTPVKLAIPRPKPPTLRHHLLTTRTMVPTVFILIALTRTQLSTPIVIIMWG